MNWKRLKETIMFRARNFMAGRYGTDQLNLAILLISLFASILGLFIPFLLFRFIYYGGIILFFYRVLSRNILKRRNENRWFLAQIQKIKAWFNVQKRIVAERKTHLHFKCPSCKQRLRVPKGRGNIKVTCSRCGHEFSKKS